MNSLNRVFEKIYVISLTTEVKRRNNIQAISEYFDFDFEFVDAVDFKSLNIDDLKKKKEIAFPNNNFYCTKSCTCLGKGHDIHIGQIACSLSHLKVWNLVIKKNLRSALILEDDVYFEEGLNEKVEIIETSLPKNWNYINLGRNNSFKASQKNIQKIKRGFSGTQMYGVSNKGAYKAKENFYPIRANIDGYIDHFVIQKRWGSAKLKNCFASTENLGINGSIDGKFETNIQNYY